MLRVTLVGAGRIGAIHAANIAAHPAAELVGIADAVAGAAEALATRHGTTVIGTDEALAGAGTDAVVICSPTDTHADFMERAAAAGKAIFCEKPIDLDAARARRCLAAVEKAGVATMVGFNRRFDPNFASLKARLDTGAIGRLEMVIITSRDPAPPPIDYVRRSGGLFRDMMIHDLDMARWLLGEEPVSIHAAASTLVDPAIREAGDVDTAVVTLKTATGKLCQIANSRRAIYGYDQRIECLGSAGMLQAGNVPVTTVVETSAAGYRADPLMPFFLERYAEAYRAELAAFVTALAAGRAPAPRLSDGLLALELAEAAGRSHAEGRVVQL